MVSTNRNWEDKYLTDLQNELKTNGRTVEFYVKLLNWYVCYPYRLGFLILEEMSKFPCWRVHPSDDTSDFLYNSAIDVISSSADINPEKPPSITFFKIRIPNCLRSKKDKILLENYINTVINYYVERVGINHIHSIPTIQNEIEEIVDKYFNQLQDAVSTIHHLAND